MLDWIMMGLGLVKALCQDTRPEPPTKEPVVARDCWWRAYHATCIRRAALAHDMEGRTARWN